MKVTAEITFDGRITAVVEGYRGQPADRVAAVVADLVGHVIAGHTSRPGSDAVVEIETVHLDDPPPLDRSATGRIDARTAFAALPGVRRGGQDDTDGPASPLPSGDASTECAPVPPRWTSEQQRIALFALIDEKRRTLAQAAAMVGVSRAKARRWYVNGEPAREDDTA